MTKLEDWNETYAAFVRGLSEKMATGAHATSELMREAAVLTGGLPVYCDVGGCLVLTPEGNVVGFDLNEATIRHVTDPMWIRVARTAAAEQHKPLSALKPVSGNLCAACGGTGTRFHERIRCGECGGSGWIDDVTANS